MISSRLPKSERLTARKDIDALFANGHTLRSGPLLVKFGLKATDEDGPAVQVLFSVPKRHVRLAVRRNRVKRHLREIYRQHKTPWWEWKQLPKTRLLMALICISKDPLDYQQLMAHYTDLCQKAARHHKSIPSLYPTE